MTLFGFDLDASQLSLFGGAGVVATWIVVHRLAGQRDKVNRQAAASAAFRNAVLAGLSSIYPTPNPWPKNIAAFLKERFDTLQSATQIFRPYVKNKAEFDAAWLRYYSAYPTKTNEQCYHHYMSAFDPLVGTKELAERKARIEFHRNVSSLLEFADQP